MRPQVVDILNQELSCLFVVGNFLKGILGIWIMWFMCLHGESVWNV